MIEQVDRQLEVWIRTVLGEVAVRLSPPAGDGPEPVVSLYLLDLLPLPPLRHQRRLPLQLLLRYLVTTGAADPRQAHRMLGELVFAAMEQETFEVELQPLAAPLWAGFGLAPRPSFLLRLPLRAERTAPATPRVRQPLEIRPTPLATLNGLVLGPDDTPLADARVELPNLQHVARTDACGRFCFPAVPLAASIRQFRVSAKGRELTIDRPGPDGGQAPIILHFNLLEA